MKINLKQLKNLKDYALKSNTPVALIFTKKYTSPHKNLSIKSKSNNNAMKRIEAIEEILKHTKKNDIIIATTGKTARELYLLRQRKSLISNDLYVVGGMDMPPLLDLE